MSVDPHEDPRPVHDVECECGQTYETYMADGSYPLEGYTKRDEWPEEEQCEFCKGEVTCSEEGCDREAMVYDTEGQEVYCSQCWAKQCDGDVAEFEELVFRRPEEKEEADASNEEFKATRCK